MKLTDEEFDHEVDKINHSFRVRLQRTPVLRHLAYTYNGFRLYFARLGR